MGGSGDQSEGGRELNFSIGSYFKSISVNKKKNNLSQEFEYNTICHISSQTEGEGVTGKYTHDNPYGEITKMIQGSGSSSLESTGENTSIYINLMKTAM